MKGYVNRERVQNFNNRINNKLELYKAANKKPVPLSVKYKFDLYRIIEAETRYWFSYDGLLTSQIQQKKLAELEKSLSENPDSWTTEQKETHDFAVKSAAEFINKKILTTEYIQNLKEDLNNFKIEINQSSKTANITTQMPSVIRLSMLSNSATRVHE